MPPELNSCLRPHGNGATKYRISKLFLSNISHKFAAARRRRHVALVSRFKRLLHRRVSVRRRRLSCHIMYSILPLLIYFLSFTDAQGPSAWDQQVDYLRGDVVPWNALIHGEFYKDIRVVSGVALRGRVVFTWKLPRDLKRGCLSVGYDLEVMNAS